jgi:hypothetical protein
MYAELQERLNSNGEQHGVHIAGEADRSSLRTAHISSQSSCHTAIQPHQQLHGCWRPAATRMDVIEASNESVPLSQLKVSGR